MNRSGSLTTNMAVAVVIAAAVATAVVMVLQMDPTPQPPPAGTPPAPPAPEKRICREITPPIETGFRHARGIAVGPDGRIYVAGDQAIRTFTRDGTQTAEIPTDHPPRALAVADDGTLYVAMARHVEVFSADGSKTAAWPAAGETAVLTSVAVTKAEVFVANIVNRWGEVLRYRRSDGELLQRFGGRPPKGKKADGLVVPSPYLDLAVASATVLWVVNPGRRRVEAYAHDCGPLLDEDGEPIRWGQSGLATDKFCGCCNPTNIAVLPHRGGFVTTEKGLVRVKLYDAKGKYVGLVAGRKEFAVHNQATIGRGADGTAVLSLDVAVDAEGRIYVLDPPTGLVRIFVRRPSPATSKASSGGPT